MRVVIVAFLVGFSLIITGAALIYHPLGFLVAGVGLMAMAFSASKRLAKVRK